MISTLWFYFILKQQTLDKFDSGKELTSVVKSLIQTAYCIDVFSCPTQQIATPAMSCQINSL